MAELLRNPTLERWNKEGVNDFDINKAIGKMFKNIKIFDNMEKIEKIDVSKTHQLDETLTYRGCLLTHEHKKINSFSITTKSSSPIEKKFEKFINDLLNKFQ